MAGRKLQNPKVVPLPVAARGASQSVADIATIVGWSACTGFELELGDGRRVQAETTLPLSRASITQAIEQHRKVLAVETRSGTWVVTGMLQTETRVQGLKSGEVTVHVDGDRLVLEGRQEIELRCGEASIVLRRDGDVVIRGKRIASRSRGPNVMTGATIKLN